MIIGANQLGILTLGSLVTMDTDVLRTENRASSTLVDYLWATTNSCLCVRGLPECTAISFQGWLTDLNCPILRAHVQCNQLFVEALS
jgi:hypothetical protein